jgi:hypothetical protein
MVLKATLGPPQNMTFPLGRYDADNLPEQPAFGAMKSAHEDIRGFRPFPMTSKINI